VGVTEKLFTARSANGTYVETFTYAGTGSIPQRIDVRGTTGFGGTIDNIEVYDVTGNVVDLTPYNNIGTRTGTTWYPDRHGQANKALYFVDTTTSHIQTSKVLNNSILSISGWFKSVGATARYFIDGRDGVNDGLYVWVNGAGKMEVKYDAQTAIVSTTTINDNTWRHFVYTYDGATSNLYINGVINATPVAFSDILNVTNQMRIGLNYAGSGYYYGAFYNFRIYDRALSQTEVTSLYESGQ
jgi:hypothetical protein